MTDLSSTSGWHSVQFGVAVGIVAKVDDDKVREGRVRLRLPWLSPNEVTDWCRVLQLYAGNGYGSFWVPEEGDEVLVAFMLGDLREPIVLGGLYNGVDKPSTFRSDTRDQKLFRTKAGHQVLLDDTSGSERVEVTTKAGHVLVLDDAGQRIELSGNGGPSITMDLKVGSLALKATTISIAADVSVEISAKQITLN